MAPSTEPSTRGSLLRHSNDQQHTDYDPAFLDWVFWWYLATIELTNRLLERQAAGEETA